MLVVDAMTPDPIVVTPTRSAKETQALMVRHSITALPVVDDDGRLIGIVSDTDLIRDAVPPDPRAHLRPAGPDPEVPGTIGDLYTRAPATVRAHDDVATAVALMVAAGVRSLPVLDPAGRLVGIVSRSDVVRLLARPDAAIAAEIRETLRVAGLGHWDVRVTDGAVHIAGPETAAERSLAESVAHTVPGVIRVLSGGACRP